MFPIQMFRCTQLKWHTYRLDSVANAKDEFVLFPHAVDKLHGNETRVIRFRELASCSIQCTSKPVPLHIQYLTHAHIHLDYNYSNSLLRYKTYPSKNTIYLTILRKLLPYFMQLEINTTKVHP